MIHTSTRGRQIRKIKPEPAKRRATRRTTQKAIKDNSDSISIEQEKQNLKEELPLQIAQDKMRLLVNSHVPQKGQYRVYSEDDKVYNASLMYTDIAHNNNKFYIVQILQAILEPELFTVFTRWGRVGFDGQTNCYPFSDSDSAVEFYEEKYREKAEKGYTEIKTELEEESDSEELENIIKAVGKSSKLDPRVQVNYFLAIETHWTYI